jgi:hypothetical protein
VDDPSPYMTEFCTGHIFPDIVLLSLVVIEDTMAAP